MDQQAVFQLTNQTTSNGFAYGKNYETPTTSHLSHQVG